MGRQNEQREIPTDTEITRRPVDKQGPYEPLGICGSPSASCEWLRDEREIRRELRLLSATLGDLRDDIAGLRSDLGAGSVRFEHLAQLPGVVSQLSIDVARIKDSLGVVQKIVYGMVGVVGLSVIGALMATILKGVQQ